MLDFDPFFFAHDERRDTVDSERAVPVDRMYRARTRARGGVLAAKTLEQRCIDVVVIFEIFELVIYCLQIRDEVPVWTVTEFSLSLRPSSRRRYLSTDG